MRSEGYSTWSVCLSVTTFSATTRKKPAKKQHQRFQRYTGFICKMAIFVKVLRFKAMVLQEFGVVRLYRTLSNNIITGCMVLMR